LGKGISEPIPGYLVVFWRGTKQRWQGHVGFYLEHSYNGEMIQCLGGNQGVRVVIIAYDPNRVLGFISLEDTLSLEIPKPLLRIGSKGQEVLCLQNFLSHLGHPCGPLKGDFGKRTAVGLRIFQLKLNGIYDARKE